MASSQSIEIMTSAFGKDILLSQCIDFEDKTNDIKKSCEAICYLYNWINKEYVELSKRTQERQVSIYEIDINTYLK